MAKAQNASVQTRDQLPAPRGDRAGTPPPVAGKRLLEGGAATYDADARTIEIVISTGFAVSRWYGIEELKIAPEAVDLSRVTSGLCPFLLCHNQYDVNAKIGTVVSARIESGALIGVVKFDDTDEARTNEARISKGELKAVSCGYQVRTWRLVQTTDQGVETWSADQWSLLEVSLVLVPADPTAGVRSAASNPGLRAVESGIDGDNDMHVRNNPGASPAQPAGSGAPATATATPAATTEPRAAPATPAPAVDEAAIRAAGATAERNRIASIRESVRTGGLDDAFAQRLIDEGVQSEHAGNRVLQEMAARGNQRPAIPGGSGARIGLDNTDPAVIGERMAMSIALRGVQYLPPAARARMFADDVPETERANAISQARQYMGLGILGMFSELAQARGVRVDHRLQRSPLFDTLVSHRSLSTSDFPLLLASASNKILLPAYAAANPTFFRIAARETFNDFKAHKFLRLGDFPNLLQKGETGELKQGAISESEQSVTAIEYGRIVQVSRQIIINDDLSAFARLPAMAAQRAAAVANTLGFNLFALNTATGPDITEGGSAVAMFHSTHANYTSSGTAIDVTSIGIGRAMMMKQAGLDGLKLNILPRILLTSADKFTLAQQYTQVINPNVGDAAKVNPFGGTLEPLADANLTSNSSLGWYLFADPSVAPCFVYGYLAGQEGPRMATAEDFNTEGVKLRCAMDYGCGGIDFRGGYYNVGA